MLNIIYIFIFFWLIRTIKQVLFWIYLWQLKDYHIGRFVDHFRTDKGKKIFFNFLFIIKLLLLIFIEYYLVSYILLLIYITESLVFLVRKNKKPVWTLKTIFLTVCSMMVVVFYTVFVKTVYGFLLFDILTPIIISGLVLFFQPFFVFARNIILEKAKKKIKQFGHLKVIAIVGSYGKTSTKEFLTTILCEKYKILATPEHKNSEIGIAQTILDDLRPEHEVFIVEMGAYNKGGIKLLCDIVKPTIGIVTGVNEQHLSTFGSMENLLSAEGGQELLENLPKTGLLIINGDNAYCLDLYKKAEIKKEVYTVKNDRVDSDIWTEEITVSRDALDFLVMTRSREAVHFNVNVLGRHNIQNLLGAILIAKALGMSLEEISASCKNIRPEQAGITLKNGVHGISIIDSSYSSNPDGVMADLDYLKIWQGKKIIVMPCLIELGNKSSQIHREIGKKISEICIMAIITTKDKFKEIQSGAVADGMLSDKVKYCDNPAEIFRLIKSFCGEGDAVLLEGRIPSELIKLLVK